MKIRTLKTKDVHAVAALHIESINKGFISSLGDKFIEYFYEGVVASDRAFGFVAVENSNVVGFISCTQGVRQICKYIIKKHFFNLLWMVVPKLLKCGSIKNIFETLIYSSRPDDDSLEILSMAVDKQAQGKGMGRALVERMVKEASERHIRKIRVMVGEPLSANEFYKQLGFKYLAQHSTHGHLANIYVMNVDIDY